MKTIHSISTLALASLSLAFTAHAQSPTDLDGRPVRPPADMNWEPTRKLLRDRAQDPDLDRRVDIGRSGIGQPAPDDWEAPRKLMQDRAAARMLRPLEPRRAEMQLQQLTDPDSKEINVAPTWRIGVMVEPLDPFVRMHLGLPDDAGVRVSEVAADNPAAAAGVEVNDIIVVASDRKIGNLDALREVVERCGKEGRPVVLQIIHKGQRKPVVIQPLGPKPERDRDEARPQPERGDQGRPFIEMQRRLDRQDKMIQELRSELKKLRKQVKELQEDEDDEEEEGGE